MNNAGHRPPTRKNSGTEWAAYEHKTGGKLLAIPHKATSNKFFQRNHGNQSVIVGAKPLKSRLDRLQG